MTTHTDPQQGNKVFITNREIYDQVIKLKTQVAAMWVTHGIIVAVLGGAFLRVLN